MATASERAASNSSIKRKATQAAADSAAAITHDVTWTHAHGAGTLLPGAGVWEAARAAQQRRPAGGPRCRTWPDPEDDEDAPCTSTLAAPEAGEGEDALTPVLRRSAATSTEISPATPESSLLATPESGAQAALAAEADSIGPSTPVERSEDAGDCRDDCGLPNPGPAADSIPDPTSPVATAGPVGPVPPNHLPSRRPAHRPAHIEHPTPADENVTSHYAPASHVVIPGESPKHAYHSARRGPSSLEGEVAFPVPRPNPSPSHRVGIPGVGWGVPRTRCQREYSSYAVEEVLRASQMENVPQGEGPARRHAMREGGTGSSFRARPGDALPNRPARPAHLEGAPTYAAQQAALAARKTGRREHRPIPVPPLRPAPLDRRYLSSLQPPTMPPALNMDGPYPHLLAPPRRLSPRSRPSTSGPGRVHSLHDPPTPGRETRLPPSWVLDPVGLYPDEVECEESPQRGTGGGSFALGRAVKSAFGRVRRGK